MDQPIGGVNVDHVDGVPVLWVEAPPPFAMFLLFRVGRADETLQNAGITHLVEHLAFPHHHEREEVPHNASTELTRTRFFAWGDPTEAGRFLHRISVSLSHLAVDRISQQRDIIAAEEARWTMTPAGELMIARYGARAHGTAGFRQLGLRSLKPDSVSAWAARYFTDGNAIACMTGPPPPSLGLELLRGERIPTPTAELLSGAFPRWIARDQPFVAYSMLGDHGPGFGAGARIVERRLRRRLREQLAVSYSVQSDAQLIDGGHVEVRGIADCRPETAAQVTHEVIKGLYEFSSDGPTAAEMDEDKARMRRQLRDDPHATASWMLFAADRYLNGIDIDEFDQYVEARESLTRVEVRQSWQRAMGSLLLCVPAWVEVTDAQFSTPPLDPPVSGRTFHPPGLARLRSGVRAVLSDSGVSLVDGKGGHVTARFDQCACLLRLSRSSRVLITVGGRELVVDSRRFTAGDQLIKAIDEAVAKDLWIDPAG